MKETAIEDEDNKDASTPFVIISARLMKYNKVDYECNQIVYLSQKTQEHA